jgi:hypothetical protein
VHLQVRIVPEAADGDVGGAFADVQAFFGAAIGA